MNPIRSLRSGLDWKKLLIRTADRQLGITAIHLVRKHIIEPFQEKGSFGWRLQCSYKEHELLVEHGNPVLSKASSNWWISSTYPLSVLVPKHDVTTSLNLCRAMKAEFELEKPFWEYRVHNQDLVYISTVVNALHTFCHKISQWCSDDGYCQSGISFYVIWNFPGFCFIVSVHYSTTSIIRISWGR